MATEKRCSYCGMRDHAVDNCPYVIQRPEVAESLERSIVDNAGVWRELATAEQKITGPRMCNEEGGWLNPDKELIDFLDEFTDALRGQLARDQERWGNTWKHRPRENQEARAMARFQDYFDQWHNAGTPMPWLKIAGEALIAWVRENHPEELDGWCG